MTSRLMLSFLAFGLLTLSCSQAPKRHFVSSSERGESNSEKEGSNPGIGPAPGPVHNEEEESTEGKVEVGGPVAQMPKPTPAPGTAPKPTPTPNVPVPTPTPQPPMEAPMTFDPSFTSVDTVNAEGKASAKGDQLVLKINVENKGAKEGSFKLAPVISTKTFRDFTNVTLPESEFKLAGKEKKTFEIKLGPFIVDGASKKEFALSRGDYSLAFNLDKEGAKSKLTEFKGKTFLIANSNAMFTAVVWNPSYFTKANYKDGVQAWMKETYTRKSETNDGGGQFKVFNKGFDEMMNVKTLFRDYEGFAFRGGTDFGNAEDVLNQVADYGQKRIGLPTRFVNANGLNNNGNHGFDNLISLTGDGFGGWAWIGGSVQASSIFDADRSKGRAQMIVIHETGHNFGADHCDPIQGFVMCSGEKHQHYGQDGSFVWHKVSIDTMNKAKQNFAALPEGEEAEFQAVNCKH